MGYDLVTQNGTEDQAAGPSGGSDEHCTPTFEEKSSSILAGIWRWIPRIMGLLSRSVFKGVAISVLLGAIFGLIIGIGGTISGLDQSTQMLLGMASGSVSGVFAMIYVIVSGVKEARRMAAG